MSTAVYPGSFDPPTNGHVDVVERAARLFERLIVAVVRNPNKSALFDAEERVQILKEVIAHLPNVEVIQHEGLTVDIAKERQADAIVKGLRAVFDLESELQMAQMNASLLPEVDTIFIATNPKWGYVSSSLIKEVARFGGSVAALVPPVVDEALRRKFSQDPGS